VIAHPPNIVDLFAGGGGASEGIRQALGVAPALAVNHDPAAIAMHATNHPTTDHLCEDVFRVAPFRPRKRSIDLLWASPDCTHHSRAKGGKPRENKRRMLAWVVVEWARAVMPRVICLENVPEFLDWGPLDSDGRPDPARKGETFREFVGALQLAGYRVEWRNLVAADFGAPTIRKRLFLVARCDGEAIRWPDPTHGAGRVSPWRTAAECIDWSIPCPSIFLSREEGRKVGAVRPLAEATLRRIAEGVRRYVLQAARPFVVCQRALVAPVLVHTANGERDGQAPRARDVERPLGTVTATGSQGAMVAAFLAKHYGGVVGQALTAPVGTVTAVDHHSLVSAFLTKFYGSEIGQNQRPDEPLHTVPTIDRFGLVTVELDGEPYALVDIGMRMLQPRELARAQGFEDSYVLTGSKREQVARIGNSVCPPVARAVVAAQFPTALAMSTDAVEVACE
jgi:DNA (cytosine-5)-methyltransferase 1